MTDQAIEDDGFWILSGSVTLDDSSGVWVGETLVQAPDETTFRVTRSAQDDYHFEEASLADVDLSAPDGPLPSFSWEDLRAFHSAAVKATLPALLEKWEEWRRATAP